MHTEGSPRNQTDPVVIIGAGPAGLTAAFELQRAGLRSTVLEKDPIVGGLARTVRYKGYRFDIGGHRFFTKVEAVSRLWREVLGEDLLTRPRLSRILFDGDYFAYPLRLPNVVRGLGVWTSLLALASYLKAHAKPRLPETNLEDWVVNRFGWVLYRDFFKTYTEKVWGIPCTELAASWAAQRIRGLSLYRAAFAAISPQRARKIRSLIETFHYPRLGPGQMWETVRDRLESAGNAVLTNAEVLAIRHQAGRAIEVDARNSDGVIRLRPAAVISSMPLREMVEKLDPPAPAHVLEAARSLRYREFMLVALIIARRDLFPDNWLYVHDARVKVGRIQNFGNWSADLVPDPARSCLGLEYFCSEGDALWVMEDENLLALARRELVLLKIAEPLEIVDGTVVRVKHAYPVYDRDYRSRVDTVRDYIATFRNIHPVGRNGLHHYNNQDHSMLTAMLAVRNILGEEHDVWSVNVDWEYHEEL